MFKKLKTGALALLAVMLGGVANAQVPVYQLRDVSPGDWAYEALRSLVDNYGCLVGYPDLTFRGERALSRYEFAAGLNACVTRMEELLQESEAVIQEDLETLARLSEEFEAELAALGARVDNLEGRVAFLEDVQFSPTTKLSGFVWFNLTGAFVDGSVTAERGIPDSAFASPIRDENNRPSRVERDQPQTTFGYYTWLTLTTSFTGKDSLVTQLATGNGNSPANQLVSAGYFNSWGTPFLDQTGSTTANVFVIRELFYSFPANDNLSFVVGPRINFYRYFDSNRFTFFVNGASSFNSNGSTLSNAVDRGSGAVAIWQISDQFTLTTAYLGQNTEFLGDIFNSASNPSQGFLVLLILLLDNWLFPPIITLT